MDSFIVPMILLRSAVASNCSMFLQLIKWGSCPTERRLGLQVAPALDQSNSQIAFMTIRRRRGRISIITITDIKVYSDEKLQQLSTKLVH